MITLGELDALESSLDPVPLFPVEAPDGRKELPEIDRQAMFIKYARQLAPAVMVFAVPNAAKRGLVAQRQAKREGMRAGVFDLFCGWDIRASTLGPDCAVSACWIEFKGYSAAGRAGELSPEQKRWGNDMHERGHKVACFFSGKSAFDWLASLGAPVRGRVQ